MKKNLFMIDFVRIIPPPPEPEESPVPTDWAAVEARVGFAFPDDYKEIVQAYGTGVFNYFLWVLNPFTGNPHLNLLSQAPAQFDALREFAELTDTPNPYALYPDPNGIYPWAVTDNGDVLYWLLKDRQPSRTIVGHDLRLSEWWEGYCSTAEFLSLVLSGSLRISLFPDDFPSASPAFVRLSEVRY